jgi:phosphatidylglycerophosphate synthase
MAKKKNVENIWNVPNALTFSRILITFYVIYLILARETILKIAIWFTIGMITDFLDGQIARRFDLCTNFGAKFDMLADRFLMISTVIMLLLFFTLRGIFSKYDIYLIAMIMAREIVSFPFAVIAFWNRKKVPAARFIGKLTTFMQGVSFPLVLLAIAYPSILILGFTISLNFLALVSAILTCGIGIVSGFTYAKDFSA